MEHAIKNFENHSNVAAIKSNRNPNDQFYFKPVTKEMITKEVTRGHQRCSIKKVLLEISQNSQENICARVSLLTKLQARGAGGTVIFL